MERKGNVGIKIGKYIQKNSNKNVFDGLIYLLSVWWNGNGGRANFL